MRVTHVSPAAFGADGLWGGGERYPLELATAMANLVPTRLVSFAPRARRHRVGNLDVVLLPVRARWRGGALNPLSERLPAQLLRGDVLHTHQWQSLVSNLAVLAATMSRRPVFCTDHGGGSRHYADRLGLDARLTGFLPVSQFSRGLFPELAPRSRVIFGGVDARRYFPDGTGRERKVVYVGRILPHKGIDVLVRALPDGVPLHLYGRSYDHDYLATVRGLAAGKDVTFHLGAGDEEILAAYRSARVSVLPSVYTTPYGPDAPRSELLGLVLLEAMACGTPVIASRVGGMPEIVDDGGTGLVVPPSDPEALRAAICRLIDGGPGWRAMSDAAVGCVRERFTWDAVARRCLEAYAEPVSSPPR